MDLFQTKNGKNGPKMDRKVRKEHKNEPKMDEIWTKIDQNGPKMNWKGTGNKPKIGQKVYHGSKIDQIRDKLVS